MQSFGINTLINLFFNLLKTFNIDITIILFEIIKIQEIFSKTNFFFQILNPTLIKQTHIDFQ